MFSSSFKNVLAKALVESCIGVNLPGPSTMTHTYISGQPVHLCSNELNPVYNGTDQKIKVELKNNGSGKDDENIRIWCYSIYLNDNDFRLYRNKGEDDLLNYIDNATVIVSHTDGDPSTIVINTVSVEHHLPTSFLFKSHDFRLNIEDFRFNSHHTRYTIHAYDGLHYDKMKEQTCYYLKAIQIQCWLKKMMLRKRLIRRTQELIPLYYHPSAKGGYFDKRKLIEFVTSI